MNLKSSLRIAQVLLLSMLRSSSRQSEILRSIFRKPIILAIISAVVFTGVSVSVLVFGTMFEFDLLPSTLQLLIGIPSMIPFIMILFGVMLEISVSAKATSTDIINWLPIKSSEYVLGSSLSLVYFMSWLLAAIFGLTLGLSFQVGTLGSWILHVALTILAAFSGAFVVEMLRSIAARVSSTFYKRGGRYAIVGRLVIIIVIITLFSMAYGVIFSPEIMSTILSTIVSGISAVWFFPMVWPSLAILSYLQSDLTFTLTYSMMSILFALALFYIGLQLRAKYWVTAPVSMIVTQKKYAPKKGFLNMLSFSSAEAALIRKDFKSLTRRREVVLVVALPVIMIMMLYSFAGMFEENPPSILIGPVYFSIYLSIISIGHEGDAISNIYSLPISEKEILRGKFASVLLPSLIILLVSMLLSIVFTSPSIRFLSAFLIVGIGLVVEAGLWGIAIGSRYADFTTVPRSKFVTPDGFMIGFFGYFAIATVTVFPMIFYVIDLPSKILAIPPLYREAWTLPFWILATAIISVIVSLILYRYSLSGISGLHRKHPF